MFRRIGRTIMSFRLTRSVAVASLACLWIVACSKPASESGPQFLPTGFWQASITLPGGDIETGFEISRDGDVFQASLINGQERVRINDVSFTNGELLLRFPGFNNEIRAELSGGELNGTLTLVRQFGKTQKMPFHAVPGGERAAEAADNARHDMSGRWAVRFHNPNGYDPPAIGEFAQRGSRLFGTFLTPNGDHRFLAGHVRGDEFRLSTFDGAHAFLFSGMINAAGEIENADFWSSTSSHQKWSAVRDETIVLPDAFSRTFLKPGYEEFNFEFPDTDGTLVSLNDEKFVGKVVLVTIAGTWCPNCNDEARFLSPFHKKYRDQGLEVITLMFEHFEEFELAAERVRQFRLKFDIEFDTLIAGISSKSDVEDTLPQLNRFLAFPTTIFVDRSGRVRNIYTGFRGPGTGEHYAQLQDQFDSLVTTMLAEPANLIESQTTEPAGNE